MDAAASIAASNRRRALVSMTQYNGCRIALAGYNADGNGSDTMVEELRVELQRQGGFKVNCGTLCQFECNNSSIAG